MIIQNQTVNFSTSDLCKRTESQALGVYEILVCYSLIHTQCVSQKEWRALPVLGPSPCRPFWVGPSDAAADGAQSVSLSPQHSLQNRLSCN